MERLTTLVLVRHAHTDANEPGGMRMSGWTDVPLSAAGEHQLARIARADLGELAPVVYSSTSARARLTAGAVARGRQVVALRSLREIACGEVEGWLVGDVQERHPELWARNAGQTDPAFRWPGGESYEEFRARILRAIRGIVARHRGERVAVVTHTGVIAQLAGFANGLSPARWDQWRPGNGSITTIEWSDSPRVVRFDDRAHL